MPMFAQHQLNSITVTTIFFGAMIAGTDLSARDEQSGPMMAGGTHIIVVVNKDQFQGKWKRFKGDLKKKWGKFTDDDLLVIEGNYDKFQGKVQERYGESKEEIQQWTDEWFEKNEKRTK